MDDIALRLETLVDKKWTFFKLKDYFYHRHHHHCQIRHTVQNIYVHFVGGILCASTEKHQVKAFWPIVPFFVYPIFLEHKLQFKLATWLSPRNQINIKFSNSLVKVYLWLRFIVKNFKYDNHLVIVNFNWHFWKSYKPFKSYIYMPSSNSIQHVLKHEYIWKVTTEQDAEEEEVST